MQAVGQRVCLCIAQGFGTHRGLVRFLLGELEYIIGRIDCFLALEPHEVNRLVFVCLGNINRSAFAQAVAHRLGVQSMSFGLACTRGLPANPLAIATAHDFGLDLSEHRTTDQLGYTPQPGDLLVTMEIRHARALVRAGYDPRCITLLGHWASPHRVHIHDPHTLSEQYFRTCFTIIQSGVINLVNVLRQGKSVCVHR